jgi:TPR repeat protein
MPIRIESSKNEPNCHPETLYLAQRFLGRRYYSGEGVNQDCEEALKWFRKTADQGLDGRTQDEV